MVLCFGELLLRLAPDANGEWLANNSMEVFVGGAEMNVAAALAKWKVPAGYCTIVPDNFLTRQLLTNIANKNIDTSTIVLNGERLGLYYLSKGSEIRQVEIIYDRHNSSFFELKKGMINWEKTLDGINWFHFSAISPALNENVAVVCEEALQVCAKKNITVSVDLNYRSKLWQYGKKPGEIMPKLVKYCEIVMGNVWSAETMLNIPVQKDIKQVDKKEIYLQQAKQTSEKIMQQFPKCKVVANTFRFAHGDINYYAALFTNNQLYISSEYKTHSVVDKVGSGDCFMAGLIYGICNHLPFQQLVNFATAAAFQKLFIKGDCTDKTVEEIRSFIQHHD